MRHNTLLIFSLIRVDDDHTESPQNHTGCTCLTFPHCVFPRGGSVGTHRRGEPTGWRLKQAEKEPVLTRSWFCLFCWGFWTMFSVYCRMNFLIWFFFIRFCVDCEISFFNQLNVPQLGPTTLSVWTGKNWQSDSTITIKCVDPAFRSHWGANIKFIQEMFSNVIK